MGAHYDTKDIPGFVGANDGASGTAVAAQLARTIRRPRHTVKFVFFDGEEAPRGVADSRLRGARGCAAARSPPRRSRTPGRWCCSTSSGTASCTIRYEQNSAPGLWRKLRAAARRVGALRVFPTGSQGAVSDDHVPFIERGVPSIDLIDFDFPCWHRRCDDMTAVSARSVDAVGETIYELLKTL